jgi:3-dehydroquinate dehydratase II
LISTIHIINGPNLNLLGKRDIDIYGSVPFEEYFDALKKEFPAVKLEYFQSNHEGFLIDKIQQVGFEKNTGIILNAGGYSHTSISLRDTVEAVPAPVVEVHISNIYKRESFRSHSYLTEVCAAHFIGYGLDGYRMGIRWLLERTTTTTTTTTSPLGW